HRKQSYWQASPMLKVVRNRNADVRTNVPIPVENPRAHPSAGRFQRERASGKSGVSPKRRSPSGTNREEVQRSQYHPLLLSSETPANASGANSFSLTPAIKSSVVLIRKTMSRMRTLALGLNL